MQPMYSKDIISRDIIKRLAIDIAQILLKLEVKDAEIIEIQYQRIEERRADLVAKMEDQQGTFILRSFIRSFMLKYKMTTKAACHTACCVIEQRSASLIQKSTYANT